MVDNDLFDFLKRWLAARVCGIDIKYRVQPY
jgi:hypothetical protein